MEPIEATPQKGPVLITTLKANLLTDYLSVGRTGDVEFWKVDDKTLIRPHILTDNTGAARTALRRIM
jgi:hypothetical protein